MSATSFYCLSFFAALFAATQLCRSRFDRSPRIRRLVSHGLQMAIAACALELLIFLLPHAGWWIGGVGIIVACGWHDAILPYVLSRWQPFRLFACFHGGRQLLIRNVIGFSIARDTQGFMEAMLQGCGADSFSRLRTNEWRWLCDKWFNKIALALVLGPESIPRLQPIQREILHGIAELRFPLLANFKEQDCVYLERSLGIVHDHIAQHRDEICQYLVENERGARHYLDQMMTRESEEVPNALMAAVL